MRFYLLSSLSLFVVLVSACGQRAATHVPESISGSATAERHSDGSVEVRETTSKEMARVDSSMSKLAAVDKRFPRPEIPICVPAVKALRVRPSGFVELSDGRVIRLDGVSCSAHGIEVLSRVLIGETTSLLVVPTAEASDQVVPADVWTVEDLEDGNVSHSSPAETALTSGWCDVESTSTSKHTERYAALVDAFREERQRNFGVAR